MGSSLRIWGQFIRFKIARPILGNFVSKFKHCAKLIHSCVRGVCSSLRSNHRSEGRVPKRPDQYWPILWICFGTQKHQMATATCYCACALSKSVWLRVIGLKFGTLGFSGSLITYITADLWSSKMALRSCACTIQKTWSFQVVGLKFGTRDFSVSVTRNMPLDPPDGDPVLRMRASEKWMTPINWVDIGYSSVVGGSHYLYDSRFMKFKEGALVLDIHDSENLVISSSRAEIWYPGVFGVVDDKYDIKFRRCHPVLRTGAPEKCGASVNWVEIR